MNRACKWLTANTAAALLLMGGCAGDMELRTGRDAAGRTYSWTPGDPVHARVYTLKNGLTVMLARNDLEPRVRSLIAVRAGSADDPVRSTGLAHYFEHMMFKGNARLGALDWDKERPLLEQLAVLFERHRTEPDPAKRAEIYREIDRISTIAAPCGNDEYWQLCRSIGAQGTNAWTSFDETVYVNDVPAAVLEKHLQLEACRFSGIALRRFHTELETVYEEFNLVQDRDPALAFWSGMKQIFPRHAYGRMVIGLPEHLKAPSMNDIHGFFRRYYRPSQMAVILAGDLDFDRTIAMVERTFGQLPEPPPEPPEIAGRIPESPLTTPATVEISGPENENVYVAWRFENTRENRLMLTMIDAVLQNGQCGLLDTNLKMPGRVQNVSSSIYMLRDYLIHFCNVAPKNGQSLEDARQLLLTEIGKLQAGDFPAWMLTAAASNARLSLINAGEARSSAANIMKSRFIHGRSAADNLAEIAALDDIEPAALAAFAAAHYRNDVTVYKRRGKAAHKQHAEKPPITPVAVPDQESAFAAQWRALPEDAPAEPVFVDYKTRMPRREIAPGVGFYAMKNNQNERFFLMYAVGPGASRDHKLRAALALLNRSGADGMDAAALQSEFYRLGASLQVAVGQEHVYVVVAGLSRYAPEAIALFFRALEGMEVTPEAVKAYVDACLKARANRLQDPESIFGYAAQYALYGGRNNYFCDEMTGEELRRLQAADLQEQIRGFLTLPGDFVYYGPAEAEHVLPFLPQRPATGKLPPARHYQIAPPAVDTVYVIDYPNVGIKALLLRPDTIQKPSPQTFASLYNRYVSQLFFTELRERQAMAYSVSGHYVIPGITADNWAVFTAQIATSPDKLISAMEQIAKWQLSPPEDPELFALIRQSVIDNIRNFREHPDSWYRRMKNLEVLGLTEPAEATQWRELPQVTYDGFLAECRRRAAGKKTAWVIMGDRKMLDMEALSRFGKIVELTREDIFPGGAQ